MTTSPAPKATQIDDILRTLSTQRTVSARVNVLKANAPNDLFKKVMFYSENPYIKFGIKIGRAEELDLVSRAQTGGGLDLDDDDVWFILDDFRHSTASSINKMSVLQGLFARLNIHTAQIVVGILQKSVAVNVSASTVNKAWPGTIPVFSVQLANKYTDRRIKSFPQLAEIKYDGVRATGLIHPTGDVEVLTRTGRPIPAAAYFHSELRRIGQAYKDVVCDVAGIKYNGCVTDGELCGETFNDAVSIFRSDAPATSGTYQVFDLLPMEALTDNTYVSQPLKVRRQQLVSVMDRANAYAIAGAPAPLTRVLLSASYVVNSKEELWSMYYAARAKNLEGIIVKDPNGLWERKRSNAWLKIKAEESEDLPVIGAFEGEGEKAGTLGGLIVNRNGVEVRVGSGFTDAISDQLWAMFLRDLRRSEQGIDDPQEYELIGSLAEVQYQEVTPDGSLRHPVFRRLRKDKNEVSF